MPIFENKGVKYDVSPEYIPDFASEYPDAVTVIERPDKPYRVKASQYDIFMQQHPEPDISVDEMRDTDNFFGDFGERLAAGAGRLVGSSTNLLKRSLPLSNLLWIGQMSILKGQLVRLHSLLQVLFLGLA